MSSITYFHEKHVSGSQRYWVNSWFIINIQSVLLFISVLFSTYKAMHTISSGVTHILASSSALNYCILSNNCRKIICPKSSLALPKCVNIWSVLSTLLPLFHSYLWFFTEFVFSHFIINKFMRFVNMCRTNTCV